MKKGFLSAFIFIIFSAVILSACNSTSSVRGSFEKEEYILSLDESEDFYNELTVKGVDKSKVTIVSSNDDIIEINGGEGEAKNSGSALIFAKYGDRVISQAKVKVKYRLSKPCELKISGEKTISWGDSFVATANGEVKADSYQLSYIDGDNKREINCQENSYTFDSAGVYKIKLIALNTSNNDIDNSLPLEKTINFNKMEEIYNIDFTVQNKFNQIGTLSWTGEEGALYDIYLEGIKLEGDINQNSFTFDYSRFNENSELSLEIIAKDSSGERESSKKELTIKILSTPDISYIFDGEGNINYPSTNQKMLVRLIDLSSGLREEIVIEDQEAFEKKLSSINEGIFTIEAMAIGGMKNENILVSSPKTQALKVGKLSLPQIEIELGLTTAKIKFLSAEQAKYKVAWGERSLIHDTNSGNEVTIDISTLPAGKHILTIEALPVQDTDGLPKVYTYGTESTRNVLNSNKYRFNYYILGQIGEINHSLDENISTFSFAEVEYAEIYRLFINGNEITDKSVDIVSGQVKISISDLNKIAPKDGGYEIAIECDRNEREGEKTVKSRRSKVISILPVVTQDANQINGSFRWEGIDGSVSYSYQLYKTEGDYDIDKGELIITETTLSPKTIENLAEGYYVVKVVTLSNDTSLYLDSNFYDKDAILTANFIVLSQIENPIVKFVNNDGEYLLEISIPDNCGELQVLVDGKEDGKVVLSEKLEKINYILNSPLASVSEHVIEVIASAGRINDANIYTNSNKTTIYVTRLSSPNWQIEEGKDPFDKIISENLKVTKVEGSSNAKFSWADTSFTGDSLDLIDYKKFGNDFAISVKLLAGEGDENHYYLDSEEIVINFKRLASPRLISWTSGQLTWENGDNLLEKNQITITLVSASLSNYYHRFFTSAPLTEFDLKSYINNLRKTSSEFSNAYNQSEKIVVEVLAYKNALVDGVYILPSANGTTVDGERALEILPLSAPTLVFDNDTRTLTWSSDEDVVIDLYIDDVLTLENESRKNICIDEFNLDLLVEKKFHCIAKNSLSLDSDYSNEIYVRQLASPEKVSISRKGESDFGTIRLDKDVELIADVVIEGISEKATWNEGDLVASFDLQYLTSNNVSVMFKAKNNVGNHHYLSSDVSTLTLFNLNSEEFSATVEEHKIKFTKLGANFSGNDIFPITYNAIVTYGDRSFTLFIEGETEVSLDEIADYIDSSYSGEILVKIESVVSKPYSLDISKEGSLGYYGKILSNECSIIKLEQASEITKSIKDDLSLNSYVEQKANASLQLTFADNWEEIDNIAFVVKLSEGAKSIQFTARVGEPSVGFEVIKEGSNYILTIHKDFLAFFGEMNISITVIRENSLNSQPSSVPVQRFDYIENASITSDGIFSFVDNQQASYLVEMVYSDGSRAKVIPDDGAKTLDLLRGGLLDGKFGDYELRIIPFDKTGNILSPGGWSRMNGYKVRGIEKLEIVNDQLIITLLNDNFENLYLTLKNERGGVVTLTPTNELTTNVLNISLIDILKAFYSPESITAGLYKFKLSAGIRGSVNSDYIDFEFYYEIEPSLQLKRVKELDKDYLIYSGDSGDITTTLLRLDLSAVSNSLNAEGEVESSVISQIRLHPSEITKGYWITDNNGLNGYFTTSITSDMLSDSRYIVTSCYGVCLNDIFESVEFAEIRIKASRLGKSERGVHQFSEKEFVLYKINSIFETAGEDEEKTFVIKDNILSFNWQNKAYGGTIQTITPSAYYVYFIDKDGKMFKRIYSSSNKVDLRSAGLIGGETYNVAVQALSSRDNVLSSDLSETITTLRYVELPKLQVKEGRLFLDEEAVGNSQFIKDISEYFNQQTKIKPLYMCIGLKQYTSPCYFTILDIADVIIKVNFTLLDSAGGETKTTYSLNLNLFHLFANVDIPVRLPEYTDLGSKVPLLTLLEKYSERELEGKTDSISTSMKTVLDKVLNYPNGMGDYGFLIDDAGSYIPAGEYMISAVHLAKDSYIESEKNEAIRAYISPAPEVVLSDEETLIIRPGVTMADLGSGMTKTYGRIYKLQIKWPKEDDLRKAHLRNIILSYINGSWKASLDDIEIDGVVENYDEGREVPSIKVNMFMLRKQILANFETTIPVNKILNVDVFAYARDNGYIINGKSGEFNTKYLDMQGENISFRDGVFMVRSEAFDDRDELYVKYKHTGQLEKDKTVPFTNGEAIIDFDTTGEYTYVIISLKGSVSNNTMFISSSKFMIENVYKLDQPTLTTKDNNLSISYNERDVQTTGTLKFNMANDVSINDNYAGTDKGYYYESDITSTTITPLYAVGATDINGNVIYPSELRAKEFYAYLSGNSGELSFEPITHADADYILNFTADRGSTPILTSLTSTLNAQMLNAITLFSVENGDLLINNTSPEANLLDGKTLYEITIKYYIVDNADPSNLKYVDSDIFYMEREGNSQIFEGERFRSIYDHYDVSIAVVGGKNSSSSTPMAIQTINGRYYLIRDSVNYVGNAQVLRSSITNSTHKISRTIAPYLEDGNIGVKSGEVTFVVDKTIYYSENALSADQSTSQRIHLYASYEQNGENITVPISGKFNFETSALGGDEDKVYVRFTPDEGQLNNVYKAFDISIYAYGKDKQGHNSIISLPLEIKSINKLVEIGENYYDVIILGTSTAIDFTKYFENVQVQGNRTCYKIVVRYKVSGDTEERQTIYTSQMENKRFTLPINITSLSIRAEDGQTSEEINPKKIFFSDTINFNVLQTNVDALSVSWNNKALRFEWNWSDGNSYDYQYYISTNISGRNEQTVVTSKYYMPSGSGRILTRGFSLMARRMDMSGRNIYLFSQEVFYTGNTITYTLYSGGIGSASSPYIIRTTDDFKNISIRNEKGFYFKLASNLTFNLNDLYENEKFIDSFKATLDGDGYQINVTASSIYSMQAPFTLNLTDKGNVSFDKFSAIFYSIDEGGVIRNLNISYNVNFDSFDNSKVIFSSLCLFNRGSVSAVSVTENSISLNGKGDYNYALVGGIVGVNYGRIEDCRNIADVTYNMPQRFNITFGYGGISVANMTEDTLSGVISNCFNQGEKSVTVQMNNTIVYMAGITLYNNSTISLCGNDGNLSLSAKTGVTSMTGYYGGIVVTSSGGTLQYLYNNGRISTSGDSYGGIAYSVSSGTINTLVETVTGQPIVKSCVNRPTSLGLNYAPSGSHTNTNISVKDIEAKEITYGSYKLIILEQSGRYQASITG